MIIDYYASFCDSGVCFNNKQECTYPEIKYAPIENMFGNEIDPTKKVTKCKIELEAHDKFHVHYPSTANWHGIFKIAGHIICEFTQPCKSNVEWINIEFQCADIIKYMNEAMEIECSLYIDNDIVCPYNLSLLIYQED